MPTVPPATSPSLQYTYSTGTYFPTPFHLQQQSQPYIGAAPPPVQLPVYPPSAPIPAVYTYQQQQQYTQCFPPQVGSGESEMYAHLPSTKVDPRLGTPYQQAQQLFRRDAQTITPEALENVKAALASSESEHKAEVKRKAVPRKAAGQSWEDPTLAAWPKGDYRLFCGDLGNEVNDDVLSKAFSRFPTFNMAKVVRENRTGKAKGFGFVSFSSPADLAAALKEMNRKYVGNRPIKLSKSKWEDWTDYKSLQQQHTHCGSGEGEMYANLTPTKVEKLFPINPWLGKKHEKTLLKVKSDYESLGSQKNQSHKKPKLAKKTILHK